MERRVLLAIFLAFIVLYVWQALFVKPLPKPPAAASPSASSTRGGAPAAPPPISNAPLTPAAHPAPAAAALVSEPAEREVRVETRDVIAVFTNRGGLLKSWRVKHFLDTARQPQELVDHDLPTQPLPFTLRAADDALTSTLNGALYAVSGTPPTAAESASVDLRFEYRDSAGLHAVKEFRLEPSSYVVSFRATVAQGDRTVTPAIVWGPAIGDVGEVSRYVAKAGGLLFQNGKVVRLAPKD